MLVEIIMGILATSNLEVLLLWLDRYPVCLEDHHEPHHLYFLLQLLLCWRLLSSTLGLELRTSGLLWRMLVGCRRMRYQWSCKLLAINRSSYWLKKLARKLFLRQSLREIGRRLLIALLLLVLEH